MRRIVREEVGGGGSIHVMHLAAPVCIRGTEHHAVRLSHKKKRPKKKRVGFVAGCGKNIQWTKKSTGRKLGVGWQ